MRGYAVSGARDIHMKEIEILIEINSPKEEALKALAVFDSKGEQEILDVYFTSPFHSDLNQDEFGRLKGAYRIRKKGNKSYVAYKRDHFVDGTFEWSHSDEYETEIEDFDAAIQINKNLGFTELVRVENIKYVFKHPLYEIVLEEVKDLGLFLEVEKLDQVSDEQVAALKQEIRQFLKSLPIEFGKEQNMGKPELLLRKRKTS